MVSTRVPPVSGHDVEIRDMRMPEGQPLFAQGLPKDRPSLTLRPDFSSRDRHPDVKRLSRCGRNRPGSRRHARNFRARSTSQAKRKPMLSLRSAGAFLLPKLCTPPS